MKKMRRLIPAIAMLLVSAVMLSTASFAWFTISNQAEVSGMQVTATAGSSLLIIDAKRAEGEAAVDVDDFKTANGILKLQQATSALTPATYVVPAEGEKDEGKIQYLTNAGAVNPATGKMNQGETEIFADCTDTGDGVYYYDYIVAIGSAGAPITGTLTATVDGTITKTIHNALTIDFLVADNKTDKPVFVDRVNLYDVKNTAGKNVVALGERTIPLTIQEEALNEYIVIIMRVYFDGALPNPAETGTTFVRNAYASAAGAAFGVNFTITPSTPPSEENP